MAWFGRDCGYDRTRVLAQATRALRKRRHAKALALYRRILEHEPHNADLHRRVAPLFARTGRPVEAWASYRRAAEHLAGGGFVDQAIGVYRDACERLPRQSDAWLAVSHLEVERGRPRDAIEALKQGRRRFRSRRDRPVAMLLLRRARQIDPRDFDVSFDLAGLAVQAGLRSQADRLLDEVAAHCDRGQLRRVRRRQFALAPGLGTGWRWLRALVGAERPRSASHPATR